MGAFAAGGDVAFCVGGGVSPRVGSSTGGRASGLGALVEAPAVPAALGAGAGVAAGGCGAGAVAAKLIAHALKVAWLQTSTRNQSTVAGRDGATPSTPAWRLVGVHR